MATKVSTRQQPPAPSTPAQKERLFVVGPTPRASRAFNKGDLLAVPLCILWGACLWLSMYGPWAVFGLESNSGSAGWLSSLWNLPVTLVRFLFGG